MNANQKDKSKSFYFFDFDDNIMFLSTPIFVKNQETDEVEGVSTSKFAEIRMDLGKVGRWKDFALFDGSYSHFRDIPEDQLQPGQKQWFVQDVEDALAKSQDEWQAPSWDLFVYACREQRPLSIVTARGHRRETLKAGVRVLLEHRLIEREPNYLSIYAVGNQEIAEELIAGLEDKAEQENVRKLPDPTSALKRIAIRKSIDEALETYGTEPEHRFGMSDDDPKNVDLIIKAMCDCKRKYPDKRFFVIDTHKGEKVKLEVFPPDYPVTRRAARNEVVG